MSLRIILIVASLGLSTETAGSSFVSANAQSKAWQLSSELVIAGAAKMYRKRMEDLAYGYQLDTDTAFLRRAESLMQALLKQAFQDYPESRLWRWEIHITEDVSETSYCMAGGKILISQPQVESLGLNDAELAMMIAHEMQHALASHNLLEYQEALRLFPQRAADSFEALETAVDDDDDLLQALSPLSLQQESQADLDGMKLAWRAGFPMPSLLRFFKKLAKSSAYANFDSKTHPAPNQRLMAAQAMAKTLLKNYSNK